MTIISQPGIINFENYSTIMQYNGGIHGQFYSMIGNQDHINILLN